MQQVKAEGNTSEPLRDGRIPEPLGRPALHEQQDNQCRTHCDNGPDTDNRLIGADPFRVGQEQASGGHEEPHGAGPELGQLSYPLTFSAEYGPYGEDREI
ncbi:hypothetical protein J7I79_00195 [Arthrobacter sp. ISL-69]|nr:hypothetical protein [Arthrobacter sp. ISL-69]MBT2534590.1 hypothetical protein [Arthrobacter sp. ISL-69]